MQPWKLRRESLLLRWISEKRKKKIIFLSVPFSNCIQEVSSFIHEAWWGWSTEVNEKWSLWQFWCGRQQNETFSVTTCAYSILLLHFTPGAIFSCVVGGLTAADVFLTVVSLYVQIQIHENGTDVANFSWSRVCFPVLKKHKGERFCQKTCTLCVCVFPKHSCTHENTVFSTCTFMCALQKLFCRLPAVSVLP